MNSRNRIHYFVAFSLLVHGVVAWIPMRERAGERSSSPAPTFIARLVEAPVVKAEPTPERIPPPAAPVVKPRAVVVPKTAVAPPPPMPPVTRTVPVEPEVKSPAPQFDMLAMINARRERRKQVEDAMIQQEQARSATAPGANASVDALTRNLQTLNSNQDGTGGVFTILSKGTRTGEFAFNGFRPDTQRRWREVIEVDAGQGGDIERAMVRRMIELIRSHYDGDFIWRSHRMGKSIVMSARPQDGPELEEFLLREFFDTPTLAHKR